MESKKVLLNYNVDATFSQSDIKMVKKLKFYNNFKVSNIHKQSILLIGNFDGTAS